MYVVSSLVIMVIGYWILYRRIYQLKSKEKLESTLEILLDKEQQAQELIESVKQQIFHLHGVISEESNGWYFELESRKEKHSQERHSEIEQLVFEYIKLQDQLEKLQNDLETKGKTLRALAQVVQKSKGQ